MQTIPQETLEILSRIQSPTLRQGINYALAHGHDDYSNHAHNTWKQKIDIAGLEDFCKTLYIDWRNDIISRIDQFSGAQREWAEKLRDNPTFNPDRISAKTNLTPFYDFFAKGWDMNFEGMFQAPAHLQNPKKSLIPDEKTTNPNGFFHVYGWAFGDTQMDKRDARLYLNLQSENIPTFVSVWRG